MIKRDCVEMSNMDMSKIVPERF